MGQVYAEGQGQLRFKWYQRAKKNTTARDLRKVYVTHLPMFSSWCPVMRERWRVRYVHTECQGQSQSGSMNKKIQCVTRTAQRSVYASCANSISIFKMTLEPDLLSLSRVGTVLAVICWAASVQRRCYPTGRCTYRPSVIC